MSDLSLDRIRAIDPVILTEIVRKDQCSPHFEITEWEVDRLSDKGFDNPDGLWLFKGQGRDNTGEQPWSVVLKVIKRPENDQPVTSMRYWKRELLVAQSGFCEQLPEPVKAPRFYRAEETADEAWLWLEHIDNCRPAPWGLDDYVFAARQIGKWNGAIALAERSFDEPWFTRQQLLTWFPDTDPDHDLQFALSQKYITGDLRRRYERLWADRQAFYDVIETLPKYFTHFDCQRRNLMIRKGNDGKDDLVLIDWSQCGLAPLGVEIFHLVGMSTVIFEWPSSAVSELDTAVYNSYLQGLWEAGWSGNADSVRLSYLAWTAVWIGIAFPNYVAHFCTPETRSFTTQMLGYAEENLYLQWLPIFLYALDCADEVRKILLKRGD